MITYPLFGLCKTPTILWILSMATLCWKLLKPVSRKHEIPISVCVQSHGKRTGLVHGLALSPTNMRTLHFHFVRSVNSRGLLSQPRLKHAAPRATSIQTSAQRRTLLQGLRPLRSCNPYLAPTSLTASLCTCLTKSRGARMLTAIESAPLQSIQQLQQRPHETL